MTDITITLSGITRNRYAVGVAVYTISIGGLKGIATGSTRAPLVINVTGNAAGSATGYSGTSTAPTPLGIATGSGAGSAVAIVGAIALNGVSTGTATVVYSYDIAIALSGIATGDGGTPTSITQPAPTLDGIAKGFAKASTYVPKPDYKALLVNSFKATNVNKFKSGELIRNV